MKDLKYLPLWDAYGAMLTENQRDICELYYLCDLSLTEIAEQKGVSKQSVSDALAKSRAILDEYERKLRFCETNGKISSDLSRMITRTRRALEKFCTAHPEFGDEIREILALLSGNDGEIPFRGGAE